MIKFLDLFLILVQLKDIVKPQTQIIVPLKISHCNGLLCGGFHMGQTVISGNPHHLGLWQRISFPETAEPEILCNLFPRSTIGKSHGTADLVRYTQQIQNNGADSSLLLPLGESSLGRQALITPGPVFICITDFCGDGLQLFIFRHRQKNRVAHLFDLVILADLAKLFFCKVLNRNLAGIHTGPHLLIHSGAEHRNCRRKRSGKHYCSHNHCQDRYDISPPVDLQKTPGQKPDGLSAIHQYHSHHFPSLVFRLQCARSDPLSERFLRYE